MQTNIGELLKQEREKKDLTLEEIEKHTRIRRRNLEAIESGAWDRFPSRTYIQGIISTYGRFLGLDDKKLLAYFRREYETRDKVYFKQRAAKDHFDPFSKKVARLIIFIVVFFFLLYFGYQIKEYYTPPSVKILEPTRSSFTKENKITLRGVTEKDVIIYINDKRVYPNDKNVFETQIPLTKKVNPVIIEVTGANGQKTIIKKNYTREKQ